MLMENFTPIPETKEEYDWMMKHVMRFLKEYNFMTIFKKNTMKCYHYNKEEHFTAVTNIIKQFVPEANTWVCFICYLCLIDMRVKTELFDENLVDIVEEYFTENKLDKKWREYHEKHNTKV